MPEQLASNDICPITDLDRAACAHCRGLDLPTDDRPETIGAAFDSRCPGCGDDIYRHHPISLRDGRYVCQECAHA